MPEDSAYVGDSIARDVLMAKRAGVFAIWAKYGAEHGRGVYEQLVRISHWTAEDVDREISLKNEAKGISPDFTIERSFKEILQVVT